MTKLVVTSTLIIGAAAIAIVIAWLRPTATGSNSIAAGAIGGGIGAAVAAVILSPLPGWSVMRILLVLPELGCIAGAGLGALAHYARFLLSRKDRGVHAV